MIRPFAQPKIRILGFGIYIHGVSPNASSTALALVFGSDLCEVAL
ncbi:hypothetical protein glysoja_019797 [Glycine soja]|nr:hypothetical protein glysoja_019797 [Glycine soja]